MIGVASILYGSVMAFTQTNVRLIAGYSSIAQLGFITIGIFSLRTDGADGSVLQMVNHGLVVAAIFLIVALLAERAGSEDLTRLGGLAMRAPVLAALFLIVTLATLAMPGLGQLHRRVLHPDRRLPVEDRLRLRGGDRGRARRLLRDPPLPAHDARPKAGRDRRRGRSGCATRWWWRRSSACIVGLALYPGLILGRSDAAVKDKIARGRSTRARASVPPATVTPAWTATRP